MSPRAESVCRFSKIPKNHFRLCSFIVPYVCLSIGLSDGRSVGRSVGRSIRASLCSPARVDERSQPATTFEPIVLSLSCYLFKPLLLLAARKESPHTASTHPCDRCTDRNYTNLHLNLFCGDISAAFKIEVGRQTIRQSQAIAESRTGRKTSRSVFSRRGRRVNQSTSY